MIIAHIISHLNTGGAEKLVAEISNSMSSRGEKIKVISLFKGRGVPFKILDIHNVELIELNYEKKFNPKLAWDIYRLTKDCDVVHTHTYYAQLYSSIFIPKKKLITTEHSTHNNRRGKIIFRLTDYLMYSKYSKIICISEGTKKSLINWIKSTQKKSLVIYNGIDLKKFLNAKPIPREDIGISNDKIVLICVGRLEKAKNHESLIKAFKNVSSKAVLLLVGNGKKEDELRVLIKDLELEDRVILLGQRTDVDRILKASDIFILPSLWEGFGLAAIEALACGLPALLSNVEGLKGITDNIDGPIDYFNANDIKEIEIKTNQMIKDISLLKNRDIIQMGDLEQYGIENMVKQYLQVYNSSINEISK
ncbi:glycosyltransferase [Bacillus mycoides]|uniref:glycosyltransferase n=1 Tax=Bacillus mycoides TaxID=1405 RepID=UPI0021117520|nr:glycosyltransferase [Bacillus mycoides]MCQ6564936.1 glycosyltransferase [Bacillus mycoides]